MKNIRNAALGLVGLAILVYVFVDFYPYLFSRHVKGVVTAVEKVNVPMTILTNTGANPSAQVFSFAVAVRDEKTKEIVTASSEDRQWAVVKPNQCAEAQFFPYPPWDLQKWGTYYNARLLKLEDCP